MARSLEDVARFQRIHDLAVALGAECGDIHRGDGTPPDHFGHFTVNPWTGDVWDLSGCEKLSTPALRKSQTEIRQRFTREEMKQYERLSRLKPRPEPNTRSCSDENARRAESAPFANLPWKVDEATAERLASEGYFGSDKHAHLFDYDGTTDSAFFDFAGILDPPPPAAMIFGFVSVNHWTGDVWTMAGCHKLSTPALRKSQAEIRRGFTREEMKFYARLSRLKPDKCIYQD